MPLIDTKLIETLNGISPQGRVLARHVSKFQELAALDHESALLKCRKILECLLQTAGTANDIEISGSECERIRGRLSGAGVLPSGVERYCRVLISITDIVDLQGWDATQSDFAARDMEICAKSLELLLKWFLECISPKLIGRSCYRAISGREVTEKMLQEALLIDRQIYTESFRADIATCLKWRHHNPDIYTVIIDNYTQQLVGYINAMPICDEWFLKLEKDLDSDADFPLEVIRKYDLPDYYKLHVCSFALDANYRGLSAFPVLYDAFIDNLCVLAKSGVYISDVLAFAVTEQGEKLANYIGMKMGRRSAKGFNVYKLNLLPPELRITTEKSGQLYEFYEKKFKEIRRVTDDDQASQAGTMEVNETPHKTLELDGDKTEDGWFSCAQIAKKYNVHEPALRKRLERFRRHSDSWKEDPNRAGNEPKYLYQISAVLPLAKELRQRELSRSGKRTR